MFYDTFSKEIKKVAKTATKDTLREGYEEVFALYNELLKKQKEAPKAINPKETLKKEKEEKAIETTKNLDVTELSNIASQLQNHVLICLFQ